MLDDNLTLLIAFGIEGDFHTALLILPSQSHRLVRRLGAENEAILLQPRSTSFLIGNCLVEFGKRSIHCPTYTDLVSFRLFVYVTETPDLFVGNRHHLTPPRT